ncbi:tetratricopeptide repeat protein [Kibdelosporangium aridum]|uniref:Tetratricopeptide repeat protein n=1 Tax=Kibdelosporangium aridum TaxID=2030 RepID=A0A428YMF3_KIBAR|nr:tetratricopeptide repeat protein [Kibdelosporangium aridum]RSM69235.1 tetratricopeptide repeat protein [Kibdelosporangium aridum]
MSTTEDWDNRVAALWAALDDFDEAEFRARIEALVGELPPGDPVGLFELASANDSTGRPEQAEPLYRKALESGLSGYRRRRALIQLASTLRNLGHPSQSVALLTAERARQESDELDDALDAFLALALVDTGRAREAAGLALAALAKHLPRYNRSLAYYATHL